MNNFVPEMRKETSYDIPEEDRFEVLSELNDDAFLVEPNDDASNKNDIHEPAHKLSRERCARTPTRNPYFNKFFANLSNKSAFQALRLQGFKAGQAPIQRT